ncbi:MAG: helix-turn-helix domain-containing protein [Acidimicrobiia bacterium]
MGEALLVSVDEAERRLGIGRTLAYALCHRFEAGLPGGLRCVRLGRRLLVPVRAIEERGGLPGSPHDPAA